MSMYDYDDIFSTGPVTEQAKPVLFPPPPPTTNTLSSTQRSRLLRSSNKLRRILGATPHYLDSGFESECMEDPFAKLDSKGLFTFDDMSFDSLNGMSDSTSASSCSTSTSFTSTTSTSTFASSSSSLSRYNSVPRTRKQFPHDTWHGQTRKPPMLRLAVPATAVTRHRRSPPLDGSPASSAPFLTTPTASTFFSQDDSPTPTASSFSTSPSSPSSTTSSQEDSSPTPSPTSHSFSFRIPSHNALRRRKMERLRKTLGEDVPVGLVFPAPGEESDDEDDLEDMTWTWRETGRTSRSSGSGSSEEEEELATPNTSPVSATTPLVDVASFDDYISTTERRVVKPPRLGLVKSGEKLLPPSPPVLPRKRHQKKIVYARDSLSLDSSPQRKTRTTPIQTIVVPQASRPAPPPPPGSPVKSKSPTVRKVTRKPVPQLDTQQPPSSPRQDSPTSKIFEHRKSASSIGSIGRSTAGLGVIIESPFEGYLDQAKKCERRQSKESVWFEGDDEHETGSFKFLAEEEVLEAVIGAGYAGYGGYSGTGVYSASMGRGMGRGLARSYAYAGLGAA